MRAVVGANFEDYRRIGIDHLCQQIGANFVPYDRREVLIRYRTGKILAKAIEKLDEAAVIRGLYQVDDMEEGASVEAHTEREVAYGLNHFMKMGRGDD